MRPLPLLIFYQHFFILMVAIAMKTANNVFAICPSIQSDIYLSVLKRTAGAASNPSS
jgi:hypothetical protein